ncbi:MAG: hypothetical protein HFG80_14820 [Eubacterium sp.]|jgi:hypothetical protein|nr:hypothetical protein [Eubacterium sp.]
MFNDEAVLCAVSAYKQQFYFNEQFSELPDVVKDELKIMCVIYTEDVGGILTLYFDEDGSLQFETRQEENDFSYDEIGSVLKMKQLQNEKRELFESLEQYYKIVFLGEDREE